MTTPANLDTTQTTTAAATAVSEVGNPFTAPIVDTDPATTEVKKPLYEGLGRTVNTQEELLEYTKHLEKKAVDATLAQTRAPVAQTPASTEPVRDEDDAIADMLFSNPKEAVKKIRDQTRAEIRQDEAKVKAENDYWSGFYAKHPDLRNAESVVQSIKSQHWEEIKNLPIAEASELMASKSREIVLKIKGDAGATRTEVTRTAAGTLPSNGGSLPQTTVKQTGPTNFVDELKAARKRA